MHLRLLSKLLVDDGQQGLIGSARLLGLGAVLPGRVRLKQAATAAAPTAGLGARRPVLILSLDI